MKRFSGKCLFLGFLAMSIIYVPSAHAQSRGGGSSPGTDSFYFEETFFPEYVNKIDPVNATPTSSAVAETGLGFNTNTTLGYAISGTWLVGVTYAYRSLSTDRPEANGNDAFETSLTETKLGPTLGWLGSSFRLLATFFISGEKKYNERYFNASAGTTTDRKFTNKEISGFQIIAGYSFNINSMFSFGPSLVYTSADYAKQDGTTSPPPTTYKDLSTKGGGAELKPMISMIFKF